jgi:acetolactate synthase regulatory subunit
MQAFHIHYRNTQGTLMRILTAVSRRALEVPYMHAAASGHVHRVDLLLDVNAKQVGQLCRDWHAIVDVTEVRVSTPTPEMLETIAFAGPHPPASAASGGRSTAAMA